MFLPLLAHLSIGYVLIRLGMMIPHPRMTLQRIAAAGPSGGSEKAFSHLTRPKQEGKGYPYKFAKPSGGMDY
jgi:hypothetical protein